MDVLDQLAEPAVTLSGRVDDLLAAAGAPDGHRIWPLLRRLRVLPGDAVRAVLGLRRGELAAAGEVSGELRRTYREAGAVVADGGSWQGPAAEAYAAHRTGLAGHLTDLAGRADATAAYAEAVAGWIADTRYALARTLADVLGSAEAVAVLTVRGDGFGAAPSGVTPGGLPVESAAAEIGARILATVSEAYDRAEALPQRWAAELDLLDHRPPDVPVVRPDGGRIVL
ncbi:hypothetical protein [Plantactinospora sp. KLBMP9567]|uniref:hypothetical protein n=1 Tax=Plantactinospora sp. KLBMP9567 TaxID=3085900 RepID=UPI002981A504|nr:hypothetical protein [Plantactinospora sp. KLBMP9567]MDW5327665.1 hypothetical protein [Plantactinospora sp. KLBMP9567]MDW5329207.1 hypothetical protein [Plantactinospora sp. KLBMP9567]